MKQFCWIFCLYPFVLSAQESGTVKIILKETSKPGYSLDLSFDSDNFRFPKKPMQWDITKDYIPRLGFNRKENLLFFSYEEDFSFMKRRTISPYLTAPYTKDERYETNSTEETVNAVTDIVVTPLASIIMVNPVAFFDYLIRIGVLPGEPFVPKKSKKERMLKTITRDVYHIDDDY